jgi:hypothetical protein
LAKSQEAKFKKPGTSKTQRLKSSAKQEQKQKRFNKEKANAFGIGQCRTRTQCIVKDRQCDEMREASSGKGRAAMPD